ncbi:MarR family winged helix-turn-helix transcriptional regulator [Methylobacterium aerolatum]|uniref:MarR family transcriptional regulator for hemolysin n=1 Tax=Methylobacterium aerolatum TaxID=418708 RepID=A0ABU0I6X4_9HYPH|nr:MarR family transcriptional regulator [Methylobacterium aerolatum]MDQ0449635.1 MarR family transcriptional regulator for hemolysin [Methylobacterium aerolatum]
MSEDLARLRQGFTHTLLVAGRQYRRAANAVAEAYGLSDATALPLLLIGRHGGEPRQTTLAEAVGIEGPSLVRLLDQLGAQGFVLRKEDPTDRRAKVLSLTPAGRAVVTAMEADLDTLREAVFGSVSTADLEASLRVFRAIQDHDRRHATGEATP